MGFDIRKPNLRVVRNIEYTEWKIKQNFRAIKFGISVGVNSTVKVFE